MTTQIKTQMATNPPDLHRRRWLYGAAAAVAALGGAGLAWWRSPTGMDRVVGSGPSIDSKPTHANLPLGTADVLPGSEAKVLAGLWALELATPSGATLALASLRGKPLLLNFWATWCPPCVEELPLIDSFFRSNFKNGWQVVGLAVDQLPAVNHFLAKTPVGFPVAMAGLPGIELSKSLGNLAGGLPFTVVVGSKGAILHRKIGRVTAADLQAWATLT